MANIKNENSNMPIISIGSVSFAQVKGMGQEKLSELRGQIISELNEATQILHWINGAIKIEQSKELNMNKKLTKDQQCYIEARFHSAVLTLHRLPKTGRQGYFNAWPDVMQENSDEIVKNRGKLSIRPSPKDITEMEEVIFEWMKCLDLKEGRVVWQRAERVPWKIICNEMGVCRTYAWAFYKRALWKIHANL